MRDLEQATSTYIFSLQAFIYKKIPKIIKSSLLTTTFLSRNQFSKLVDKIDCRKHLKTWNCKMKTCIRILIS